MRSAKTFNYCLVNPRVIHTYSHNILMCMCVCVTCYDMIPSRNMFVYEYIIFAKINILCYGGKTIH